MSRPRVLLAEDHPGVAEALRQLLEPEFDVVSVVGDGDALVREAAVIQPDIVVTDIAMPGRDGIAATRALLAWRPATRVVLVTVHDDAELIDRGVAAGALGFVLKVDAARDLVPAVRSALQGCRYIVARGSGGRPTNGAPPGSDREGNAGA